MQVNEAMSQTADEFLVVVSRARIKFLLTVRTLRESGLLAVGQVFVRPGELVQDGPVEAVIDRIQ